MIHRMLLLSVFLVGCADDTIAPDMPPPNQPPVVVGELPYQRLAGPGETATVDVAGYFADPDGDALAFSATSTDTAVVGVVVGGSVLTLTGGSAGGAGRVTVTARDPDGAHGSGSFGVTVNRPPVASVEISAQTLWHGATRVDVDLTGAFSDPDGDTLTYAVASSDTSVVPVVLHAGPMVSLAGPIEGKATVTVTARDPDGLGTSADFDVMVQENPDRAPLEALWHATDGPNWLDWEEFGIGSENWMSDAPLSDWHGVEVNEAGRVSCLARCGGYWHFGELLGEGEEAVVLGVGEIPPEVGNLAALERLLISGPYDQALKISSGLARLANLRELIVATGIRGRLLDPGRTGRPPEPDKIVDFGLLVRCSRQPASPILATIPHVQSGSARTG